MHPDRYGLGLMLGDLTVPLRGVHACGALPACKCQLFKCYFHTATVGHAGLDYGSGMPLIGHLPAVNLSYSIAVNVGESMIGMNTSQGIVENANIFDTIYCRFFDLTLHAAMPDYPAFKCGAL